MSDLFFGISCRYIPRTGTQAHRLLVMLWRHPQLLERDILNEIGPNYRSPLQQLEGDRFGWWSIARISVEGEKAFALDARHLLGCSTVDWQARLARYRKLKGESYSQAVREKERLPRAKRDLEKAYTTQA